MSDTIIYPDLSINLPTQLRQDVASEEFVNQVLAVAEAAGVPASAELMDYFGVPLAVATRVLLHPEQRRKVKNGAQDASIWRKIFPW